jgi:hypothetical protein
VQPYNCTPTMRSQDEDVFSQQPVRTGNSRIQTAARAQVRLLLVHQAPRRAERKQLFQAGLEELQHIRTTMDDLVTFNDARTSFSISSASSDGDRMKTESSPPQVPTLSSLRPKTSLAARSFRLHPLCLAHNTVWSIITFYPVYMRFHQLVACARST